MARDVLLFGWEKARRKAVLSPQQQAKNVPGGESSSSDPSTTAAAGPELHRIASGKPPFLS
jgi:hypothetical protein